MKSQTGATLIVAAAIIFHGVYTGPFPDFFGLPVALVGVIGLGVAALLVLFGAGLVGVGLRRND